MTRSTSHWTAWAVLTVLVGAWLRLHGLDAMEFKADEQVALDQAIRLIGAHPWLSPREWPTHGMTSSNGVGNAPLFTWLVAAAWAPTRHPVAVAACVALVNALCLYPLWRWARRHMDEYRALVTLALCAVSPFAVAFSRKIWTQDLLLPGVLALLWGVEWLRGGRLWRGAILLLFAVLVAGQLHQSGPIALVLLPLALGVQWTVDRRRGEWSLTVERPTRWEFVGLAVAVGLNLMFWLPYLHYLLHLPPGVLARRPQVVAVRPVLLRMVGSQVVPLDLFTFFEPHRGDFLQSWVRWGFFHGAVVLGAPLAVYGLWRWLRAPLALPVFGLWWAGIIAVFALAKIPTHPFYVLILAPFPAVLAAGAFDGPFARGRMSRPVAAWRVAYVVAMLGLTVTTHAWLGERGGADGDYDVAYAVREAQARQLASPIAAGTPAGADSAGESRPGDPDTTLPCAEPPPEVLWLARWLDPSRRDAPRNVALCAGWVRQDDRLVYRWTIRQ